MIIEFTSLHALLGLWPVSENRSPPVGCSRGFIAVVQQAQKEQLERWDGKKGKGDGKVSRWCYFKQITVSCFSSSLTWILCWLLLPERPALRERHSRRSLYWQPTCFLGSMAWRSRSWNVCIRDLYSCLLSFLVKCLWSLCLQLSIKWEINI